MVSILLAYCGLCALIGGIAGAIGANFGMLGPFPAGGFWYRTIFGALIGAVMAIIWPILLLT